MTVHAAKGLEFPVVAVADLGRGLGTGSRDGDVVIGRIDGADGDPAGAAREQALRTPGSACACRSPRRVSAPLGAGRALRGRAPRRRRGGLPARLRRGHASPGPPDPERHLPRGRPRGARGAEAGALGAEAAAPGARASGAGAAATEPVELEPAPAIGGGPPPGRRRGSGADPGAQRGAGRRAPPPDPVAGAERRRRRWIAPRRPCSSGSSRAAAAGHLSYSALATYARCGYRFYVERVLGLEAPTGA